MAIKKKKDTINGALEDIKKANDDNMLIDRKSSELINVPLDTKTAVVLNKLAINDNSYTNRGDITSIVGKDKETGMALNDTISMILKASSEKINAMNYKRFVRSQVLENRWMLDNMPQLRYGLLLRQTGIFAPDDVTKNTLIFSSPQLNSENEDVLSIKEVQETLENEVDFEKLILDTAKVAGEDGFAIIYKIPYAELANEFISFSKNKDAFKKAKGIYEAAFNEKLEGEFNITESDAGNVVTGNIANICEMLDVVDITEHVNRSADGKEEVFYENIFPKNHWTDTFKDSCKIKIQEAARNTNKKEAQVSNFFTNIFGHGTTQNVAVVHDANVNVTGVYTEILNSEMVVPVMIKKQLIGIYYMEQSDTIGFNKLTQTKGILDRDKAVSNLNSAIQTTSIVDYIRKIIERNIDTKFIKNNKHILKELRDLLNESMNRNDGFKIRFIPKEYLELYTDTPVTDSYTLGQSILQDAKTPIYFWIFENKNIQLTEFFYKRPKIVAKINTKGVTTDMEDYIWKSVEALENMYSGANLHNVFDVNAMHSQMSTHGRVIIPKGANGEELIEVEVLPGQSTTDNLETLRLYEKAISTIMNTMVSSDEDSYIQFASSYANRNVLATRVNLSLQKHHSRQISRIATNLYRLVNNKRAQIDPEIKVSLPPPKALPNTANNDFISVITQRADELATKLFTDEQVAEKRHYVKGYMAKHLKGIENIEEDFDDIMKTFDKTNVPNNMGTGEEI